MSAGKSTEIIAACAAHRAYYGDDQRRADKMKARERQKFCPRFDRMVYSKRYVLPTYRQVDYYPQNIADKLFASSLLVPLQTVNRDDVMFAALGNALKALVFNRPQLWLETELGQAFIRTNLPEDMTSDDVEWRWPGFRVHLPKGLLHISDLSPTGHDLMFMDICLWPEKTWGSIPQPYAGEIEALAREYGWQRPQLVYQLVTPVYDQTALIISGCINGMSPQSGLVRQPDDYMIYAVIKPFSQAIKFGQIRRIANENLDSPYQNTSDDTRFCEQMLHLALNILIFLGSMPLEYQVAEHELRKPKLVGRHQIPGLYAAKFVGQSQLRPRHGNGHLAGFPTGKHLAEHVRAGHWTRQPHGPKSSLRKLIWIKPLWVAKDHERAEISATAKA